MVSGTIIHLERNGTAEQSRERVFEHLHNFIPAFESCFSRRKKEQRAQMRIVTARQSDGTGSVIFPDASLDGRWR